MRRIAIASLLTASLFGISACGLVLGIPSDDDVVKVPSLDGAVGVDGSDSGPGVDAGKDALVADTGLDGPTPDAACGANLATDPANCGACGHSCLGGGCAAGKCKPALLMDLPSSGPSALAVDGTYVFYSDPYTGSVGRVSKTAKLPPDAPVIVAAPKDSGNNDYYYNVWRVATDGTNFYFSDTGNNATPPLPAVYQCPVAGCGANNAARKTLFSAANQSVGDVLVQGSTLYFTTAIATTGTVRKCTVPDCPGNSTAIATNQDSPELLATDGTDLFWGLNGLVRKCPLSGACTPSTAATTANAYSVAASSGGVFVTNLVFSGSVVRGPSTTLANNQTWPYGIVADKDFVYWTNRTQNSDPNSGGIGRVLRCAVGGCSNTPDELFVGQMTIRGITQDATAIYFAEYGAGKIWKLAK